MTYIARKTTARVIRFLAGSPERGFCVRCERETEWMERDHYFRCTGCGQDPLLHADADAQRPARIYHLNGRSAA